MSPTFSFMLLYIVQYESFFFFFFTMHAVWPFFPSTEYKLQYLCCMCWKNTIQYRPFDCLAHHINYLMFFTAIIRETGVQTLQNHSKKHGSLKSTEAYIECQLHTSYCYVVFLDIIQLLSYLACLCGDVCKRPARTNPVRWSWFHFPEGQQELLMATPAT